ncbi:2,3-bisphosphoglycerate-independent phosphoglycerate mutase [bacterium]
MKQQELMKRLSKQTDSKIVFLVMDGIGGVQHPDFGDVTALEKAKRPNLDKLAKDGLCGFTDPIMPGITPGSGPAHAGLFGYNPLEIEIGRGLLDTLGIDFDFSPLDMAARGNFAAIDDNDIVTDRRAGRISTEECNRLCNLLSSIKIDGVEIFLKPVKEHRFSVIFRAQNLDDRLNDSDPQKTGLKPFNVESADTGAQKTADMVNEFIYKAKQVLKNEKPANMILLRGFSKMINIEKYQDIYKLNPSAIATYPMYRGLAKLAGMNVLPAGETIESEFESLEKNFKDFDYFFIHIKKTDSYGEDGNFPSKVKIIEEVDKYLPKLTALNPDVIVVTGDHSTPALLKGHSWHPVPTIIWSKVCRKDEVKKFNETECIKGGLGRINAQSLMPIAMANAGKLMKFGA